MGVTVCRAIAEYIGSMGRHRVVLFCIRLHPIPLGLGLLLSNAMRFYCLIAILGYTRVLVGSGFCLLVHSSVLA